MDDPVRWSFVSGAYLLQAGCASLLLRDHGTPWFVTRAVLGAEPFGSDNRISIGEGVAGIVAERGVVLAGEDAGTIFLSVPIMTDHGVEGVFTVSARGDGRQFADEDIPLAVTIAAHIGQQIGKERVMAERAINDLPDHVLFDDLLERELARSRRAGSPLTVAIARLHRTEASSPAGGTGPEVIPALRDALRAVLRRYDVVARYGQESFALLVSALPGEDEEVLRRVAGTVAAVLHATSSGMECRIGVARCPADGISSAQLLAAASGSADGVERVDVPRHDA